MKISDELRTYLDGGAFSNGVRMPLASWGFRRVPDRLSWLERFASGKRVVHVGCIDHLPLIEAKIARDHWLHGRLCRSAARCLGVDVNGEGIDYLKERLGYEDVVCADLSGEIAPAIRDARWDAMVLAEVVEHIDDPVRFLCEIRAKYAQCVDTLLVTVPNALQGGHFLGALFHEEVVNSDHRYCFTPYTMAKVLTRAGFRVADFSFVTSFPMPVTGVRTLGKTLLFGVFPALAEGLVMSAHFQGRDSRAGS